MLVERNRKFYRDMNQSRLPGWEAFVVSDQKAIDFITKQEEGMRRGLVDDDEVLYEKFEKGYREAHRRVNNIIAEKYREQNRDPEMWELRYLRWMSIEYVKFNSPYGTFFVFPLPPRRRPKVPYWYTAEEMIGIMSSGAGAIAAAFEQLPARPESLSAKPGIGEEFMTIDFTGSEVKTTCVRGRSA